MNVITAMKLTAAKPEDQRKCRRGFSLIELMVAMSIFLIVGGAAVALVRKHVPLFTEQQGQSNLNLSLRNAAAQMQIDVVNAGTGYYPADDIPAWDLGLTIINRGGNCYDNANRAYTANCFDTLNVIAFDTSVSAAHPIAACSAPFNTGPTPPVNQILQITPGDAASTPAQLAAAITNGTELLLVNNNGTQLTTVNVIADATVVGGVVNVPIESTLPNGVNQSDNLNISNNVGGTGGGSIADGGDLNPSASSTTLGTQFCASDWVLKLAPITYGVDTTDKQNPKLFRQAGGRTDIIAEQVIGFKVGAAVRNAPAGCEYSFNSSNGGQCAYSGDWAAITAVKISLIGRTSPQVDVNTSFRNTFDQGSYKIEGVSLVVNPRNLTMKDN